MVTVKLKAVPDVAVAEAALVKVGTATAPAALTVRVKFWGMAPAEFVAVSVIG